jgi:hypothetical protein
MFQLLFADVAGFRLHHQRHGHFALDRMRHADDRRLGDGRMAEKHVLDFERIDVLAAGIEHVVRAALEIEKPLGVAVEHIAGFQPSVFQALAVDLPQAVVARRHARVSNPELAVAWGFLTLIVVADGGYTCW